jgi:hypothetical protein
MSVAAKTLTDQLDIEFTEMPGVRLIRWIDSDRLIVGTVGGHLQMRSGEERLDWAVEAEGERDKPLGSVRDAAVSFNGEQAAAIVGPKLYGLSLENEEPIWEHRPKEFFGFMVMPPRTVTMVDAKILKAAFFVTTESGQIETRSVDGHLLKRRRETHAPRFADWCADRSKVVGADFRKVSLWDPETLRAEPVVKFSEHIFGMSPIHTKDQVMLRVENRIVIHSLSDGELVSEIAVQPGLPVLKSSFDGSLIAYCEGRGAVVCSTGAHEVVNLEFEDRRILTLEFHPREPILAIGLDDGSIEFWQP